jgi:hypothetical protein
MIARVGVEAEDEIQTLGQDLDSDGLKEASGPHKLIDESIDGSVDLAIRLRYDSCGGPSVIESHRPIVDLANV